MRGARFILVLLIGFLPFTLAHAAEVFSADGLEFFENRIRPVLVASCYECHSAEAGQAKGGLLLDTREGLLKGGDHGPAIVISQPDDDLKMPPKKSLTPSQVKDFEEWIRMGLPDPRQAGTAQTAVKGAFNFDHKRLHWAYQPVRDYVPSFSKNHRLARSYLDHFLLAELDARGRKPTEEEVKLVSEHLAALASTTVVATPGQGTGPTSEAAAPLSLVGRVPSPGVGGTTTTEISAWSSVARAILASNEFVFVD